VRTPTGESTDIVGRTEFPTDALKGIHILLVDDDADTRALLETVLQYCGALVTAVDSARAAMTTLERVKPDLLLSDLSMPERDGYWLIRELRARPADAGGSIPAIAVTALGLPHGVDRSLAAGFQAHMSKPVDPWELARTISGLVGRRI
jgi:CheY-like chemotaxis protein